MILRQKLSEPIDGYWDGGKKSTFDWSIENFDYPSKDSKGEFVKVGSWNANFWFHVAKGKTIKQTLSYAKAYLKAKTRIPSTFEYIEQG